MVSYSIQTRSVNLVYLTAESSPLGTVGPDSDAWNAGKLAEEIYMGLIRSCVIAAPSLEATCLLST